MQDAEITKLRSLFTYDPATGVLRWKVDRSHNARAGAEVGHASGRYRRVSVEDKSYQVHRIAFALMTGRWPKDQLDHINRVKTDNRWENLREATNQENQRNRDRQSNNTSGHSGVVWHSRDQRWHANVKVSGKRIHLGSFKSRDDAINARLAGEAKYFDGFVASFLD